MTAEQAVNGLQELGGQWTRSKISRMESAQAVRPSVRDVRDMLDVYGCTDAKKRDALVAMTKDARQRGWWTGYNDVLKGAYVGLEAEASSIWTFEPVLIPGLLQTAGYARTLFKTNWDESPTDEEIEKRVEVRYRRQEILARPEGAPRLWAIIDEGALHRPIGGREVMREQLEHLLKTAERPNVGLQVVPTEIGAHPGVFGAFVLLGFADPGDAPVAYIETPTDGLYLEQPEEIRSYTLQFDHLRGRALDPPASAKRIQDIIEQFR